MDREAAVIRSEMIQTRVDLEHKLAQLQARARAMTPRRIVQRNLPEYFADRVIGGILTLAGVRMAWHQYRERTRRAARVRAAMASYGRW
jgi:hypothetical protein